MAFTPFEKKRDFSGMPEPPVDGEKGKLKKKLPPPGGLGSSARARHESAETPEYEAEEERTGSDPQYPDETEPEDGEDDMATGDEGDMAEGDEGGQEGTPDDPDAPEDDEGGTKQTASFALVRRAGETCGTCENYTGGQNGTQETGTGDRDDMSDGMTEQSGKCQVVAGQFSPDDSCGRFYMPKMGGDEGDSMHVPAGGHAGGGMTGGMPSANGGGKFHGLPEPPRR